MVLTVSFILKSFACKNFNLSASSKCKGISVILFFKMQSFNSCNFYFSNSSNYSPPEKILLTFYFPYFSTIISSLRKLKVKIITWRKETISKIRRQSMIINLIENWIVWIYRQWTHSNLLIFFILRFFFFTVSKEYVHSVST